MLRHFALLDKDRSRGPTDRMMMASNASAESIPSHCLNARCSGEFHRSSNIEIDRNLFEVRAKSERISKTKPLLMKRMKTVLRHDLNLSDCSLASTLKIHAALAHGRSETVRSCSFLRDSVNTMLR